MSYPKLFSNAEYSDSFIYLPWAWLELQTYLNPNPARYYWKDCIWICGNQRCKAQGILASDSPGNFVCSWIQYFHVGVDCKKIAARRLVITLVIRVAFEEEGEYSTAWILIQSQDWPARSKQCWPWWEGETEGERINPSVYFAIIGVNKKFFHLLNSDYKSFHLIEFGSNWDTIKVTTQYLLFIIYFVTSSCHHAPRMTQKKGNQKHLVRR